MDSARTRNDPLSPATSRRCVPIPGGYTGNLYPNRRNNLRVGSATSELAGRRESLGKHSPGSYVCTPTWPVALHVTHEPSCDKPGDAEYWADHALTRGIHCVIHAQSSEECPQVRFPGGHIGRTKRTPIRDPYLQLTHGRATTNDRDVFSGRRVRRIVFG